MKRSWTRSTALRGALAALALAVTAGALATGPASADERHNDRGRRPPARHYYHHPAYGYGVPTYGPPPPIVYAPPGPPAALNFIIPLNFR